VKILVDICHPAHVHFFRHPLSRLAASGHETAVTSRAKDVTLELLDAFGIPHAVLSTAGRGAPALAAEYVHRTRGLLRTIRHFRPDVITGISSLFLGPVGRLTGTPALVFSDTEHVKAERLTYRLAARYCTPEVFERELGPRHRRYAGFHELAYLDPRRFRPDPAVLGPLGLGEGERFSVLRLVSWTANHDRGHSGLSDELRREAVARLSRHGRVLVSSEAPLPPDLRAHRLDAPVHRIHDVLALASLYLGEGATMATEAAFLGTPAVYVSSLAGTMGNFRALQAADLVVATRDGRAGLERAEALLADPAAKAAWRTRAQAFALRHVDVVDYVTSAIEDVGLVRSRAAAI
jgi:predicted glycosyltransferase